VNRRIAFVAVTAVLAGCGSSAAGPPATIPEVTVVTSAPAPTTAPPPTTARPSNTVSMPSTTFPPTTRPTTSTTATTVAGATRPGVSDIPMTIGPLALGATLTLPAGAGPVPAVLLLAGSGPADRDETVGANKPLADLAAGLAARGIATLRFDKRAKAHPEWFVAHPNYTLDDEYLIDGRAALVALADRPEIDPKRIFVLGHSQGGTVAPLLATTDHPVAGVILLAPGVESLFGAIARQTRYLAAHGQPTGGVDPAAYDTLAKQAADPTLSATHAPIGGLPASYLIDLRDHPLTTVLPTITVPILIAQGGRDYQVTVADDLQPLVAAMGKAKNLTVKQYPNDDHLFLPGAGASVPTEYLIAGHLDPQVVADVAMWIGATPGG
jgi:dienelactone hydrolase